MVRARGTVVVQQSSVTVTFENLQAQTKGQSGKKKGGSGCGGREEGEVLRPRAMSINSPPPLVDVRLLLYHQEWALTMENRLILEVV